MRITGVELVLFWGLGLTPIALQAAEEDAKKKLTVPRTCALSLIQKNTFVSAGKNQLGLSKDTSGAPGQADGCRHVFLDVGANAGIHVRMLFEPELYKNDTEFLSMLDKYFGTAEQRKRPSIDSGLCAFAFEANPLFTDRHKEIEAAYAKMGWRAKFFTPAVVSTQEGTTEFYLTDDTLGSSIVDRQQENVARGFTKQTLPTLDLAEFVAVDIAGRRLPRGMSLGSVLMKMDVEGEEFTLIPHMLERGVLCSGKGVDAMTLEEHSRILEAAQMNFTPWWQITEAVRKQPGCSTPTIQEQEQPVAEVYTTDTAPLPGD